MLNEKALLRLDRDLPSAKLMEGIDLCWVELRLDRDLPSAKLISAISTTLPII